MWDDELMVIAVLVGELAKLDEAAQLRVLRYVTDRLSLPVLVIKARPLVPDIDRCEEIEAAGLSA